MEPTRKPSAEELFQILETTAEDDEAEREADRILALSPEELRRELVAAGIDPDEGSARMGELVQRMMKQPGEGEEPPLQSPKPEPISDAAADYIWNLLADDEAKRIDSLTDEELRAEWKAVYGTWEPPSVEELLERVKARAARREP